MNTSERPLPSHPRRRFFLGGLFLAFFAAVLSPEPLAAQPVRMGYFVLPPHQFVVDDPARPRGASIVYFEALAARMGIEVEWVGPLPLLRLSEFLKTGELDGTVGFIKYQGLEDFLYYTDVPLFYAQPALMVRMENPLTTVRSIEDIRGYRIGLQASILNRFTPIIDENSDKLVLEKLGGEKWIEQNLRKLMAGRLDAFFNREPYSLLYVAVQLCLRDRVKILELPDPPTPMYVTFCRASSRGAELLRRANAALPGMSADYVQLIERELLTAGL